MGFIIEYERRVYVDSRSDPDTPSIISLVRYAHNNVTNENGEPAQQWKMHTYPNEDIFTKSIRAIAHDCGNGCVKRAYFKRGAGHINPEAYTNMYMKEYKKKRTLVDMYEQFDIYLRVDADSEKALERVCDCSLGAQPHPKITMTQNANMYGNWAWSMSVRMSPSNMTALADMYDTATSTHNVRAFYIIHKRGGKL